MKVLLVYPGVIVREVPLSLLYISSCLKKAGFDTKVFQLSDYGRPKLFRDVNKLILDDFRDVLEAYEPDVVGISLMTINYAISMKMARLVKEITDAKVICGGIHPTIDPDETIKEDDVDMIAIGESEASFVELLELMDKGKDYSGVKGTWVKERKEDSVAKIHKNPIRHLEDNLDELPFPDREALPDSFYSDDLIGTNIMSSRGCPYPCTFCQNKFLMDIYSGKGRFVRYRSFDNIFKEIDFLIKRYKIKKLYFSDETFTMNKPRLIDFCKEFKKRYGKTPKLSFMCQTRVDTLDEEIVIALKDAGCSHVSLAIESGNENIRKKMLKKPFTNEQIIAAFKILNKHGLKTQSFNMVGLPGESKKTIFDTINLNREVQADRVLCSVFMPFKGTELGELCIKKGIVLFDPKESSNYYNVISIKYSRIDPKTVLGYQGFFDWYVRLPERKYWMIDIMRVIYQSLLTKKNPRNRIASYFRYLVVEYVYRAKRWLPVTGDYYVKKR